MCGRFALANPTPRFGSIDISALQKLPPQYNIAPGSFIHMLVKNDDKCVQLVSKPWGVHLQFSKNQAEKLIINARSETAHQKPLFSKMYTSKRCIILATGFYEWNKQHNPYYFFDPQSTLLGLAGIYNKEAIILTKPALASFRTIHHRMPVLISPSDTELWLSSATSLEQLNSLLHKDQNSMLFHPVSTLVNSPSNNTSMCIEPISDQLFS